MRLILYTFVLSLLVLLIVILYYRNKYDKINNMDRYIINLDKRTDRLYITMQHLHRYGYKNIVRFRAIDSSTFDNDKIDTLTCPKSRKSIYNNYRTHDEQLSVGAIGCYLSHLALWEKMIAENKSHIMIFEDDTMPSIHIKNLNDYIKKVPNDWDIILLGGVYRNGWHIIDNVYKIQYFYCLHAYIIRNTKNIQYIVKRALPMAKQLDWYLSDLSRDKQINIYGIRHTPQWKQNSNIASTNIQTPIYH